jgi:hypothetical protein
MPSLKNLDKMNRISCACGLPLGEGFHPVNPVILSLLYFLAAVWLSCATAHAAQPDPDIARFISAKSNQVYLASRDSNTPVPPEVWQVFAAASASDWKAISNLLQSLKTNFYSSTTHRLAPEVWYRTQEVGGFGELIASNNLKFIRLFADEVFKVVPSGSIYFGGTDPGRFAITALSRSQEEGKPFFTLTQNQLADTNYLTYIRGLYRQQIKLPGDAMVNEAFNEYLADAKRRFEHDQQFPNEPKQVEPGEEIRSVNGRVQVSGQTAVMTINGLLVRDILQDNPERDCYIEESYALDWMYPYLEPAGPIFKLRHAAQEALFEEAVRNDREYWQKTTRRLIGQEVHVETPLAEVCAAAQELVGKPVDFQGDPAFLRDEGARKTFSKLRSSISGLYSWRAAHSKSTSERRQMEREAELACKQAYLFCPQSPEAIWRCAMLFISQHRVEDAQKFIAAARKLNPDDEHLKTLAHYAGQMAEYEKNNR